MKQVLFNKEASREINDEEIAEGYLLIQSELEEMNRVFTAFSYSFNNYLKSQPQKDKVDFKIESILYIFNRVNKLYGQIYYELGEKKISSDERDRENIWNYQELLLALISKIKNKLDIFKGNINFGEFKLDKRTKIYDLGSELEEFFKTENRIIKLKEKILKKVKGLIIEIWNKKETRNFRLGEEVIPLSYYCNKSFQSLIILKNISFLNITGEGLGIKNVEFIKKRSNYFFNLDTEPIPHYNLEFKIKHLKKTVNVHVIPLEEQENLMKLAA